MKRISLIVPCLNEEEAIPAFKQEIDRVFKECLEGYAPELIFVDDGSTDRSLEMIKKMAEHSPEVKFISFSRNFGKEAAIYAGLEAATGDYAAVMDVDLQDPPSLLPDMLKAIEKEGYDCAGTRRVTRQGEPLLRSFFARAFYKTIHQISDTRIVDGARDYKLMTRPVLEALLSLKEYNRFSKGLYEWVGFRTKWFEYENVERVAGETKWSFFKLFLYSIEGIVAFSTAPPGAGLHHGGTSFLYLIPFHHYLDGPRIDLAPFRLRMDFPGMRLLHDGGHRAAVPGHFGPISGQNLYGS